MSKISVAKNEVEWIHRPTTDGEIYYNRSTRSVHRSKPVTLYNIDDHVLNLPSYKAQAPLKVYFDFTYLCNLECRHCITNSSPRADSGSELKTKPIEQVMDELATIGVLELGIGGGEPLCHPDIYSLLSYGSKIGLNTVVTTNGQLVTVARGKLLKESGVTEVRVSFEGSETVHDNIRGKGVYRRALKALQILIDSGVNAVPRLTLSKEDPFGLERLFEDLKLVGATSIKAALIEPRGRASLEQNKDLFKYNRDISTAVMLEELAEKHSINLKVPADLASSPDLADGGELRMGKVKSCGSGLETAYISPTGNVQPCSGTPEHVFGNLVSNTFMGVWTNPKGEAWRQQMLSSGTWCVCVTKIEKLVEKLSLQGCSEGN